jgi:hypothetical protein
MECEMSCGTMLMSVISLLILSGAVQSTIHADGPLSHASTLSSRDDRSSPDRSLRCASWPVVHPVAQPHVGCLALVRVV